ncbi:hypothetical protein V502_06186 [Pseudogymnoascus sp. VKM F-4520 (FW-2644)]|nr:hypothetical protein V502_06186 [Pseudogymnoascus sp. VKM F-4520 (FW-2644)]
MTSTIILQGGTVLYHDDADNVTALKDTDVLVTGNLITEIGKNIVVPPGTTVIDCHGKIISPGFIDTHHHMWQTQLKGRHMDETLLEYMASGNPQSFNYTPEDMFWGQLGGCLEAIDAGTTFVLDHSHSIYTAEHTTQCLAASSASGLRLTYAYSAVSIPLTSWTKDSIILSSDILPAWSLDQLEALATSQPFGNGRVTIGLGFDFFFLPREMVIGIFNRFRKAGVKVITCHVSKNAVCGTGSTVTLLHEYGLLGPDIVLSHATGLTPDEHALLYSAGANVSSTPTSEAQMGLGWPVALHSGVHGSLGVDSHAFCESSILSEARTLLLLARQEGNLMLLERGEFPERLVAGAREAFNLATVGGARAVGMQEKIGRVRVGYLADLVVVDGRSPAMWGVAEWDPVVAVLGHSSVRDVETVIVDGVVRKRDGKLVAVELDGGERLGWEAVAKKLATSREAVQERIERVDVGLAKKLLMGMWHIDESKIKAVV